MTKGQAPWNLCYEAARQNDLDTQGSTIMATQPDPKPNRIDPQSPPETPAQPLPTESPPEFPGEAEPMEPDFDQPGTHPDEF